VTVLTSAKNLLKRSAAMRRMNAVVKNARLERRSREVAALYARRLETTPVDTSHATVRAMIEARTRADGIRSLGGLARRPRIFLVGTEYEQERAGFIQGLEEWGDVVPLCRSDGTYGITPPSHSYDRATIEENGSRIIEQIDSALATGPVDVLVGTMVATYLPLRALQQVRARGIPVVNIAMDDRLADHWGVEGDVRLGAIGLAPGVDLVLQTTPEYVPRYLLEGCPAIYWPFGSDPRLFAPSETKEFDVSFVGNNYGWRAELIDSIVRSGIRIECFGRGFANGHIGAERVPQVLARSRIVLGVGTIAHSNRIVPLKLRDFDGPMSGALYVTTENSDLHGLYEVGKEIVTYRSPRECVQLLRFYLRHEEERRQIAAAGRRRASHDHTWRHRIGQALGLLGFRAEAPPLG
jgi:hypothetical protein